MSASNYVAEMQNIDEELRRMRARSRQLQVRKKVLAQTLHDFMHRHNYAEFKGVRLKSIAPRPRRRRKPKREKRRDGVTLLRDIGVPDPERFYDQFSNTQRYEPQAY